MKIISLQAESFKRIKAISIDPKGNMIASKARALVDVGLAEELGPDTNRKMTELMGMKVMAGPVTGIVIPIQSRPAPSMRLP